MPGRQLKDCIKIIEDALSIVEKKAAEALGIKLTEAEVELSVVSTDEIGGKVKFDLVVSVDVGGKIEGSNTHVLTLILKPKGGALTLGSVQAGELAEAILALATAFKDANLTRFRVDEGTVEVKFVVTSEGKLKVVGGYANKSENTHSIKLTFEPES